MKKLLLAFLAGLIVMAGGGYLWLHRQPSDPLAPVDEPKSQTDWGPRHTMETIAVGEVVNGIHRLNRLVVFRAYVTATTTTHDIGRVTQSDQTMLTPAFVNYYIDMDAIDPGQVRVVGKHIYVPRPAIMIERPNIDTRQVQIFNDGLFSQLTSVSEQLRIKNNRMALKQLLQRAKIPFLVEAARAAAAAAEEVNVRHVLAAAGHTDVIVHVGS